MWPAKKAQGVLKPAILQIFGVALACFVSIGLNLNVPLSGYMEIYGQKLILEVIFWKLVELGS